MARRWSISLLSILFNKDAFPDSPIQYSTLNLKHHCFQGHVDSLLAPISSLSTPPTSSRQHVFGRYLGVSAPERCTLLADGMVVNVKGMATETGCI